MLLSNLNGSCLEGSASMEPGLLRWRAPDARPPLTVTLSGVRY